MTRQREGPRIVCACGASLDPTGHPGAVRLRCLRCGQELAPTEGASPPAPPVAAPATQIGKYAILREVGRGAMGVVYEAEDPQLRRRVALKVTVEAPGSDVAVKRFHREAAVAAQLRHANIVAVHEVGSIPAPTGVMHFIAMDFVEGRTFAEVLRDASSPLAEKVRILEEVARAAGHAHAKGIVHRDLKPANILVEAGGRAVLTDFGIARAETFHTRLTATNEILGTPSYMAPEQIEGGARSVDARADVYALGAILYEVLVGRPPFSGRTFAELTVRVLRDDPVPPSRLRPVEPALEAVCLKALEKEPARRYPDGAAFAEDLSRFRRGEPVLARAPGMGRRAAKSLKRRLGWIAAGAAVVVAIAIAVAALRASDFRRARGEARSAAAAGNWRSALAAAERAGQLRGDPEMRALAAEARRRLDETEAEQRRRVAQAEAYRRLRERMDPVERRILQLRQTFYIANADIRRELDAVERALDGLESLAQDEAYAAFSDAWVVLGSGRYYAGDARRAEAALLTAEARGSKDPVAGWVLGRIHLERSVSALVLDDGEPWEVRKARAQAWAAKARERLLSASGGWGGATEIERHALEAYTAFSEARGPEVVRMCSEGLARFKREPGTEEYCLLLALLPGQDSARHFEACLARRPHYAFAQYLNGSELWRAGRESEALRAYDRAIEINPRLAHALVDRASIRFRRGDARGAIDDCTRALDVEPDLGIAYNNRAIPRYETGDAEGALEDLRRAIEIRPHYPGSWVNRGNMHREQGRAAQAQADYDRALEIDPKCWGAWHGRALLKLARQDATGALADLDRAVAAAPKAPQCRSDRARARAMARDFPGALEDATEALRVNPTDFATRALRGFIRGQLRDYAGAVEDLEAALTAAPRNWPSREVFEAMLDEARRLKERP